MYYDKLSLIYENSLCPNIVREDVLKSYFYLIEANKNTEAQYYLENILTSAEIQVLIEQGFLNKIGQGIKTYAAPRLMAAGGAIDKIKRLAKGTLAAGALALMSGNASAGETVQDLINKIDNIQATISQSKNAATWSNDPDIRELKRELISISKELDTSTSNIAKNLNPQYLQDEIYSLTRTIKAAEARISESVSH